MLNLPAAMLSLALDCHKKSAAVESFTELTGGVSEVNLTSTGITHNTHH